LLGPGDGVSFFPVDAEEYATIDVQVSAGEYELLGKAGP